MIEEAPETDWEKDRKEFEVLKRFDDLLRTIQANKPNDWSERDKIYAVAITDLQKVYAWFNYVFDSLPKYEGAVPLPGVYMIGNLVDSPTGNAEDGL